MRLSTGSVVAVVAVGVGALSAEAAVVYAHNGIILASSSQGAYVGATTTDSADDFALVNLQPIEPPFAASGAFAQSRIDFLEPSATSHADRIQGKTAISYGFGDGFEADTLKFSVLPANPVRAQSALNSAGEQADGRFVGEGRALFSVDGSYADGVFLPPGTIIGAMSLAAVAGLDAFTTFSGIVTVYDGVAPGGTELLAFSSVTGFSGAAIALQTGVSYEFIFRYEVLVPFGTVPASGFAPESGFDYSATITAVPVPGPGAMGLIGLAGLCARRRRN